MKTGLALALSLATVLAVSGCVEVSSDDTSAPVAEEAPTGDSGSNESADSDESSQEQPAATSDRAGVGQTLTISGVDVTVNSVETSTVDALSSSPDEEIYLIIDVTVVNNSSDDLALSSLLSFSLRGSDAYDYSVAIFVDTKGSLDTSVATGDQVRGQIAFDVPNLDHYDFSVQPTFFGDTGVFRILATDIP